MKRAAMLATVMMLATTVPVAAAGLDTPEDAVREYLYGFAQADIGRMMDATATDEMVEGYRLDQQIDVFRSFAPQAPGPVHHPFFADIQHTSWTAELLGQARMLSYSLLAQDTLSEALEHRPINPVDAAWATDLMVELDPSRLSDLDVTDIAIPRPDLYDTDPHRANMSRIASVYGASEMAERAVLLAFEDDHYLLGFILLRYEDEWKVRDLVSPLTGPQPPGVAQPTTLAEFTSLTSE